MERGFIVVKNKKMHCKSTALKTTFNISKKLMVLGMASVIAVTSTACSASLSTSSAKDAAQRVSDYNENKKTTKPAQSSDVSNNSFEGETIKRSADKATDGTDIPVVGMNQKATYNNVDIEVLNAWKSDNLALLDELEENTIFKDFILKELTYGETENDKSYDEDGNSLKSNTKWVFLKVRITNHNDGSYEMGSSNLQNCLSPYFYKSTDGTNFNFSHLEAYAFDKYKGLTDGKDIHKYALYYTFEQDEQMETIIACRYIGGMSLDNLYISIRFLSITGFGATADIPTGCPMIKIDFDN